VYALPAFRTLGHVAERHGNIKKIEKDTIDLFEVVQEFSNIVDGQELTTLQVMEKSHDINLNVENGTKQIENAKVSARSRNRKKWWCSLLVILILIGITVVVAVVVVVIKGKNKETA
jgi:syntaxin 1B/2/3